MYLKSIFFVFALSLLFTFNSFAQSSDKVTIDKVTGCYLDKDGNAYSCPAEKRQEIIKSEVKAICLGSKFYNFHCEQYKGEKAHGEVDVRYNGCITNQKNEDKNLTICQDFEAQGIKAEPKDTSDSDLNLDLIPGFDTGGSGGAGGTGSGGETGGTGGAGSSGGTGSGGGGALPPSTPSTPTLGSIPQTTEERVEQLVDPLFAGSTGSSAEPTTSDKLAINKTPEGCVSTIGFPTLTCFTEHADKTGEDIQIQGCTDGGFCFININTGASAPLGGIGINAGDPDAKFKINPANLTQTGGGGGAAAPKKPGEEPKYTAEVEGADDWADPVVETVINPETGEEIIEVKPNPKPKEEIPEDTAQSDETKRVREEVREAYGNIPDGARTMKIIVKEDGKVIAEIPLAVDLQEAEEKKKSKPISFSFWGIIIILLGLAAIFIAFIKRGEE